MLWVILIANSHSTHIIISTSIRLAGCTTSHIPLSVGCNDAGPFACPQFGAEVRGKEKGIGVSSVACPELDESNQTNVLNYYRCLIVHTFVALEKLQHCRDPIFASTSHLTDAALEAETLSLHHCTE